MQLQQVKIRNRLRFWIEENNLKGNLQNFSKWKKAGLLCHCTVVFV
jgi:hypothetical protein